MSRTRHTLAMLAAVLIAGSASAAFGQTSGGAASGGAGAGTTAPSGGGTSLSPAPGTITGPGTITTPGRPTSPGMTGTTGSGINSRTNPSTGQPCTGAMNSPTAGTHQTANPSGGMGGC